MDIVAEVREILIAAKPANQDVQRCRCKLRLLPQAGVDELLRRLNAMQPIARTYEIPLRTVSQRRGASRGMLR